MGFAIRWIGKRLDPVAGVVVGYLGSVAFGFLVFLVVESAVVMCGVADCVMVFSPYLGIIGCCV